jgi:hypothetical protein
LKLTGYLGVAPRDADEMMNEIKSAGSTYLVSKEEKNILDHLIRLPLWEFVELRNPVRRKLLAVTILFYQYHFDHVREIKSYRILREVFD